MTRFSSALAISFSLLALVGVGFVLTGDTVAPVPDVTGAGSAEFERLRIRLNELEHRLDSLPTAPAMLPAPVRRDTQSGEEPEPAEEKVELVDGDAADPSESALLNRLEAFETRLRGLEEDPTRRAFTYLESGSAELRKKGVYDLENLAKNDPEARDAILHMLADTDAGVRVAALDTLTDIEDKAVIPFAADLLDDESTSVRREAISTLTRLGVKDSAADIANFIDDEDGKVRELAADSMGKLGHAASAGALLSALSDENPRVRGEAISSLGQVGAKDALPRLQEIYKTQAAENVRGDGDHRLRLAHAMKELGDRTAIQSEITRLGDVILKGGNDRSRSGAMRSLLWYGRGEPAARELFQTLTQDRSEWIRREASRALQGGRENRR